MAIVNLPLGSIVSLDGNALTEHNRKSLAVDINRIESSDRTANGGLRKYVIADKLKWSVTWENCPDRSTKTVDGKWGGAEIRDFYEANPGVFTLTVKVNGVSEVYNAVITSFNYDVAKRAASAELWDFSITIEEA